MAYQKLQQESAIDVTPSDDARIPNPASANVSGRAQIGTVVTTLVGDFLRESGPIGAVVAGSENVLTDAAATFETVGVEINDIVVNVTAAPNVQGRVLSVISETQLVIEPSPIMAEINNAADNYEIRKRNNFTEGNYTAGDIVVNTTTNVSTLITLIGDYRTIRTQTAIFAVGNFFTVYQNNNGTENLGCILYVGVGGDIQVLTASGQTVIYTAVPQGIWMPIQVRQVFDTNTTATNLIAQW